MVAVVAGVCHTAAVRFYVAFIAIGSLVERVAKKSRRAVGFLLSRS